MKLSEIPRTIDLVWHGVNDPLNLERFLQSPIPWGEGDLRQDPEGRLTLRHDSFDTHPRREGEPALAFEEWTDRLLAGGKSLKVDLKEGGATQQRLVDLFKKRRVDESRLWITTNLKDVSTDDYGRLRGVFPRAILQSTIPIRFMYQVMAAADRQEWLDMNRSLGVTRLSVSWYDGPTAEELGDVKKAGFEINLYHVNSVDDFKRAIALRPEAITSDFHIPEWNLFGRGSGENWFYLNTKK